MPCIRSVVAAAVVATTGAAIGRAAHDAAEAVEEVVAQHTEPVVKSVDYKVGLSSTL